MKESAVCLRAHFLLIAFLVLVIIGGTNADKLPTKAAITPTKAAIALRSFAPWQKDKGPSTTKTLSTSRPPILNLNKGSLSPFQEAPGAIAPLGFFDPLGFLKGADMDKFDRYRSVELKHGRISMLAVLGHIVTTKGDRFPGELSHGVPFSSVKNGLAALDNLPVDAIVQIVGTIGLLELGYTAVEKDVAKASCESFIGRTLFLRGGLKKKQNIELSNGRLAMIGIIGLFVHEKLNNDPYVINALLGAPLAFNE